MDNSFRRQGPTPQQKSVFLVRTWFLGRLFNWLADFTKLTKEEQEDASVYLGRLGDE